MSEIDDFFAGGNKSASFDGPIGTSVAGTIVRIGSRVQATDFKTGELKFYDKERTQPIYQVPIDLQTDQRDPAKPGDTGVRVLFVGGLKKTALVRAMRDAGFQGAPQVGDWVQMTFSGEEPPKQRGGYPTKLYTAQYRRGVPQATKEFFAEPASDGFAGQVYDTAPAQTAPAQTAPAVAPVETPEQELARLRAQLNQQPGPAGRQGYEPAPNAGQPVGASAGAATGGGFFPPA